MLDDNLRKCIIFSRNITYFIFAGISQGRLSEFIRKANVTSLVEADWLIGAVT